MDTQTVWQKSLDKIKQQISLPNFRGWFVNTRGVGIVGQKFIVAVPSAFIAEKLKSRYLSLIESVLEEFSQKKVNIEFKVDPGLFSLNLPQEEIFEIAIESKPSNGSLNPKFTLENFVVGLSNNVAFAAAQAVASNPGLSYNPLFIYGGVGVGKTHLMLGIGNFLLHQKTGKKIVYCSSEQFMNDYVAAIQNHRMGDLRHKYRSLDVLLVDDIQFFSGREGTQEEFFHTFNELQSKNSQMVLTSDRPPGEIAKLEDRLKSRFQGGLMVDIQPPDYDTRVAILQAKCNERGETLPEEVLKIIASREVNIRELEGKLIQILQGLKTKNLEPTPENITPFLGTNPPQKLQMDYKKIISSICDYFALSNKDLIGPRRHKELVLPRQILMYLFSEELKFTVEKTGQILGGRDHTTVMHGRDKIKELVIKDREVQKLLIDVRNKLST